MKTYSNDPRQIIVKFDCLCAESKKMLKKGQDAIYYPSSKQCFALDTKQATEFYSWKQDCMMGHEY
jgi:hypothetical protein